MKQHPILFSTPMVQAILAGNKTQTRRIIKPQPIIDKNSGYVFTGELKRGPFNIHNWQYRYCDYFQKWLPEDILWVRETWAETTNVNSLDGFPWRPHIPGETINNKLHGALIYKADGPFEWCNDEGGHTDRSYWKPSIFMPKDACRIFLKVKSVCIERLQDISQNDIIAEGINHVPGFMRELCKWRDSVQAIQNTRKLFYKNLWESINGPTSWDANPFVWVIEFERTNNH